MLLKIRDISKSIHWTNNSAMQWFYLHLITLHKITFSIYRKTISIFYVIYKKYFIIIIIINYHYKYLDFNSNYQILIYYIFWLVRTFWHFVYTSYKQATLQILNPMDHTAHLINTSCIILFQQILNTKLIFQDMTIFKQHIRCIPRCINLF